MFQVWVNDIKTASSPRYSLTMLNMSNYKLIIKNRIKELYDNQCYCLFISPADFFCYSL